MQQHTWCIKIHRSCLGNVSLIMAGFRRSGFVVSSLGESLGDFSYPWAYSLQHTSKHAMTLYMLTHDCTCFTTVTLEELL
jgi:hypothetical protein